MQADSNGKPLYPALAGFVDASGLQQGGSDNFGSGQEHRKESQVPLLGGFVTEDDDHVSDIPSHIPPPPSAAKPMPPPLSAKPAMSPMSAKPAVAAKPLYLPPLQPSAPAAPRAVMDADDEVENL